MTRRAQDDGDEEAAGVGGEDAARASGEEPPRAGGEEPARAGDGEPAGGGIADLHTHLMPGVDDGARDPDEAVEAARRLEGAGVAAAVATPHMPASATRGERFARQMEAFDAAWERLRDACGERLPGLRLERGVELRLDDPDYDLSDPRVRLAGGRSVLVEFDGFQIPHYGPRELGTLSEAGWRPVLAHPERYMGIGRRMEDAVPSWRDAGAALLVNVGSLLGVHGPRAREAAGELLERGWADALASDYHARGELPWAMGLEALAEMEDEGGEALGLLTRTNPRRILEGRRALPVPPLTGYSSVWTRLRRWLG